MYKKIISSELNTALKILKNFLKKEEQIKNIEKAAILIAQSFKNKKKSNFMWKWWFSLRCCSFF